MPRESRSPARARRRICFVTGTRAEFGLMRRTLDALRSHPAIDLQLIATGTHTQAARGNTLRDIRAAGFEIDAAIPWRDDTTPAGIAKQTGHVSAKLAEAFQRLLPDIVLVVGDRVEAFAAASAAHLSGVALAHVHGGDRAMGQVDDSLRHAISKLAHVHLCATRVSGDRLYALGEDRRRIHVVGAPGIDGICEEAVTPSWFSERVDSSCDDAVLFLLHPTDANERAESIRTTRLIRAIRRHHAGKIIALMPNSDPGSPGIASVLKHAAQRGHVRLLSHVQRSAFLGLMRDCRVLIGNSSSGIIEAGSFGTPVLDIGPRQQGREHGRNVRHTSWNARELCDAVSRILRAKRPKADNPYDRGGAAKRIARILAECEINHHLLRKVIRY